jgi:hypothetical protein
MEFCREEYAVSGVRETRAVGCSYEEEGIAARRTRSIIAATLSTKYFVGTRVSPMRV